MNDSAQIEKCTETEFGGGTGGHADLLARVLALQVQVEEQRILISFLLLTPLVVRQNPVAAAADLHLNLLEMRSTL